MAWDREASEDAEIARLRARVAELEELLRNIGANRYWEERWRDESTENNLLCVHVSELEGALTSLRPSIAEIERDEALARVKSAEAERDEYKQCANVEAGLRREFLARAECAEAERDKMREALQKVIDPDE